MASNKSSSKEDLNDIPVLESTQSNLDGDQKTIERPPIVYDSFSAFTWSSWLRFKSLWTKRFVWSLLAGQVVSLCITCTSVATTELVMRNWTLPTTQTFFLLVFKSFAPSK